MKRKTKRTGRQGYNTKKDAQVAAKGLKKIGYKRARASKIRIDGYYRVLR